MFFSAQVRSEIFSQFHLLKAFDRRISRSWFLRHCWFLFLLSTLGALSYLIISHFFIQAAQVKGSSMYPTLCNAGHYWVDRLCYVVGEPCQEDIVALKDPSDHGLDVKRIIATPGQFVGFKNGRVYVNGRLLKEPYLLPNTPTYAESRSGNAFIRMGRDQFFVLGDNRGNSADSRVFGAVSRQEILGKIVQ